MEARSLAVLVKAAVIDLGLCDGDIGNPCLYCLVRVIPGAHHKPTSIGTVPAAVADKKVLLGHARLRA